MKNLDKRLTRLEKAVTPDGNLFTVIKYDVEAGPPAGIPSAGVIYLPDNGRDRIGRGKSLQPHDYRPTGKRAHMTAK